MNINMLFVQAFYASVQRENSPAQFPEASTYSKLTGKIIAAPKRTGCYDVFADGAGEKRLKAHTQASQSL
jgi:hypothetical protein